MTKQEALSILGLSGDANRSQIRHAYSEKSKIYHVETHPEEFHRLHEAYKTALSGVSKSLDAAAATIQHTTADTKNIDTKNTMSFSSVHRQTPKDDIDKDNIDIETPASSVPAYEKLLDQLVEEDVSIQNHQELIQLIYYKCRYDESTARDAEKRSLMDKKSNNSDDLFIHQTCLQNDSLEDNHLFLGTLWSDWKTLAWTPVICHPEFMKMQYDITFLTELCQFLQKETMENTNGISQNLYYSLCIAYGFFYEEDNMNPVKNTALESIENILLLHPKHQDYLKDLENWEELKNDRKLTRLCQKAFAFSTSNHSLTEETKFAEDFFSIVEEMLMSECTSKTKFTEDFFGTAEETLMSECTSKKEFIFHQLAALPHTLFSAELPEHLLEITQLEDLQKECFTDFYEMLLDHANEELNWYQFGYKPLCYRIQAFKDKYLTKPNWKKIICSPFFAQSLKDWMFRRYGNYVSSLPSYMEYNVWQELVTWFDGESQLEQRTFIWLTTTAYFSEYYKRYQHELIWREQRIQEDYFKEVLPIPELNQGKLDLLEMVKQGTPACAKDVFLIIRDAGCPNEYAFVFLTRITNALVHFKFLITTQKSEKNAVPGDVFCFMKDEVILYYKKENRTCYLTHQAFYDILSRRFDFRAERAMDTKLYFTDDFIDTACKNLYYYRCYIESFQSSSDASGDANIS